MKIAEIITRKDTDFRNVYLWDEDELTEVLKHSAAPNTNTDDLAKEILSGKKITLGTTFVSTFRIATAEDIDEAISQKKNLEKELEDFNPPEVEKFRNALKNFKG